ncbi:MAG: PIN domain-containing protein, partial [Caldilineaceae bacterium]|nr:PIN domain-containing protein [Caldilineaceae bacterium]
MTARAQTILQQAIQQGLTLCLDSNCLLYYFGGQQPWQNNLHPIFEAKDQGRVQLVTSSVTLAEVLARAYNPNEENQLLNAIRRYFEIVPVLDKTGIDAARIRQGTKLSVKTPDALEMATATQTSATLFITNDEQLIRTPLPGSQM